MYAIKQRAFGGPEVLEFTEAEQPVPGPDDVLVRVRAASVNPADWKIRTGGAALPVDLPFIPGFDLAGVVERIGDRVSRFRPGDDVFGMPTPFTGTYAQYVRAPAADLALKPAGLDHNQAAALSSVGLTAWQALVGIARIQPGQRVLIHAAAGGIGHIAIQIAKAFGAHVIGTARTANHGFLRDLGADELVDYTLDDFAAAVRNVDIVLDNIGHEYGVRSLATLAPGGHLVSTIWDHPGVTAEDVARAKARFDTVQVAPSAPDLKELGKLVEQGRIRVHVADVLPLRDAAEGHRRSESGRVRGKLVLVP
ncbi:NADPH:quinone reductase-like Zn-dependent oxidoreductase [Nonomuraea thailandensis]|uniref:NADPH:quinone reductase-like Zn-dependent oxidoreductase n=1 Tax=Nonomuraea thailandensis TaxID=1188745 RepID=A0A9X2GAD6_9ACTN|nr:NADP-dependent oxidoreductase [Nonomuraea thailandensis]MCP2353734.1 NADPH:quinone reductase-like Zn-dependent oxidoreductase [Nonomuraea thailandensis]